MKVLQFPEKAPAALPYARILRCIGQKLETLDLKAFELKNRDGMFLVQGWYRGTSSSMDIELRYTSDDVIKQESEASKKRRSAQGKLNPLNLSQVLRLAGSYVDRLGCRLLKVSWQNQTDKIQSITIQYESLEEDVKKSEHSISTIDEISVHIYRQRKKIPTPSHAVHKSGRRGEPAEPD